MTAGEVSAVRERPDTAGWRGVALAIRSMRESPVLLTVVSSDCEPLWIDLSTSRYYWERPLASMPEAPGDVTIYSQPVEAENPPYPWVVWRAMDPLLWQMGRFAFGTDPAAWLRPGERYALQRWPNLTEIPHSTEELRMIATLANDFLTAEEFGLLTGADPATVRRMLNMLSLMGAVKAAAAPLAPPAAVERARSEPERAKDDSSANFGFLSRVRDKMGGGR